MDKALRNAIIAGIIIIALSFGYYLVYRPIKKQAYIKQCDKQTGSWKNSQTDIKAKIWQAEYDKCLREKGIIN